MKIVFATGNKGKLREAADILGPDFELSTPAMMGISGEPEETGSTLRENSLIKAKALYDALGCDCFADDTGLEVDALGGAPGVYSARYAGKDHDFDANIDKLLGELEGVENRKARFRCVVTLIKDGEPHFFDGVCEGGIALRRSGNGGFGYDPVFVPDAFPDKTFAELGESVKNGIAHRGMALRAMAEWLKENG